MSASSKSSLHKWIIPLTAVSCLVFDAMSKGWARTRLVPGDPVNAIPGFARFFLTHNTGAAFSLGAGNSYLMTGLASVVTLSLVAWMLKRESSLVSNLERVGLGFLFGGACGNLLDRFTQGRVTDFIEFTFINFPVFNCADVFIDIGIGLILIAMSMEKSAGKKESAQAALAGTGVDHSVEKLTDKGASDISLQHESIAQNDYHG